MQTYRIALAADGHVSEAAADSAAGPAADGGAVHEIVNCPPEARPEDAMYLVASGRLPAGSYRHNFGDLAAAQSSCCGSCGG